MIVRERSDDFVLIEQDNHAIVSGDIMSKWKSSLFKGQDFRKSVEYAIYKHDCGWHPFDKQPFWNDESQAPYTFVDFPTLPKIVLYKNGIDEVEKVDAYAALLCSEHYKRFLLNNTSTEAQSFVKAEELRQKRIFDSFKMLHKRLFNHHYSLIQLGDNLSLYICLNEPGVTKENEHRFFKNGIPLSSSLNGFNQQKVELHWMDTKTIAMSEFPFENEVHITLKQKTVAKKLITNKGLLKGYEQTPYEEITVRLIPGE
ncbi:hypothetical protein CIL05_18060 [Virgibacillus profundi]|uniref:Uncharacterized protein n=1 Tax=Virgibacillus profundi TaxID=2024555 RepID=A0A2A2I9L8_9BACI|nr:DUF3891 family protein [Virgibacillus profundi]PAV28272.1 hypothetical protein CIL05_18060 [Virgibacillus profundi]PXY52576.1 DUF3891 domain-containing protein [Virgibacillus profundi]